jgi:hypothetical protein
MMSFFDDLQDGIDKETAPQVGAQVGKPVQDSEAIKVAIPGEGVVVLKPEAERSAFKPDPKFVEKYGPPGTIHKPNDRRTS